MLIFITKKTCSDLTIVNKFNWLCLYCLRIYFASWKDVNPGTDNIKTTKAGPKKEEKEKKFSFILQQFDKLMKLPDDEKSAISKRIKLLIKNMFSNKETGW